MDIRPETILVITDMWLNCGVHRQMVLIRKFLDQLDNGIVEEWEEYLLGEILDSKMVSPVKEIQD